MPEPASRLAQALADRYRLERELGQGGMATVYLAQDLKHDRKVALKVLRPELAAVLGAERFVVEIKTTAQLQHPHILPLFDSGTADGFLYYVMPYVEGETLRGRLDRERQLGVEEAVRITTEVADALDYAHRHGVIHRDIKPENVLLHDGRPMVADFGIALAVSAAAGGRMTETGLSLGTPHYMSPEQATAEKEITGRSDIYSLASVLYEMLTGDPPHTGASAQQIIMKIVTDLPRPVTELRKAVPPSVAAAVAKALEKLPADRFESAKSFKDALTTPGFRHGPAASAVDGMGAPRRPAQWAFVGAAALLGVTVALGGAAALGWLRPPSAAPLLRLDVGLDGLDALNDMAISPDGSTLAVTARDSAGGVAVYVRRLDGDPAFRRLPGTEGGLRPAFSPDNQWIVFFGASQGGLDKASLAGGGVISLVPAGDVFPSSAHWGTDDHIVFWAGTPGAFGVFEAGTTGAFRVSAHGGPRERLDQVTGPTPFLLPDGSAILWSNDGDLWLYEFATDSLFPLGGRGSHPTLVGEDALVYVEEGGALAAVRFDRRGRRIVGSPVVLAAQVGASSGVRGYSVSRNGSLVLLDAPSRLAAINNRLVVATMGGPADTLRLPPARRTRPRFSPDGRMLAFEHQARGLGRRDIYTFDLTTGTTVQRTSEDENVRPIWSPDGTQILFRRGSRSGTAGLFLQSVAERGSARRALSHPEAQFPLDWAGDDLVLLQQSRAGLRDLVLWSPSKGETVTKYLDAPWNELEADVSPDGHTAAFVSDERGPYELWLRDFPVPQGKWHVAAFHRGGWGGPRWSPDGRYLYYIQAADTLFRVRVERSPAVRVGPAEVVQRIADRDVPAGWDLHPDGRRFVFAVRDRDQMTPGAVPGPPRFRITLNWADELRRQLDRSGR